MEKKEMKEITLDSYCQKIISVLLLMRQEYRFNQLYRFLNEHGVKISKPTLAEHLKHLTEIGILLRKVEGIQKVGGIVARLTRNPYNDDHDSETALDKENYDWDKFNVIIDNADLTIEEQCTLTYQKLQPLGYLPYIPKEHENK